MTGDDWIVTPVVPWGPAQQDKVSPPLSAPSGRHWLGTDALGIFGHAGSAIAFHSIHHDHRRRVCAYATEEVGYRLVCIPTWISHYVVYSFRTTTQREQHDYQYHEHSDSA